ncbi:hypothetical protein B0T16DRAFT_104714 [Cercophora newfieldiana]|uniref:Uncharacterized protein n=1 Tax=Cercophora newfieldiana TaxID=92897 RepID=A0AA39YHH3_9PEZI|nr:hypothetical protein B0T16DRAFT_104714 [Cercophora newfieldiana]
MNRNSTPSEDITDVEEAELQTLTPEQVEERIRQHNAETDLSLSPTKSQLLSPFTVFCLVTNRTIASGIFTQPVNVLRLSGSSGQAIALWVAAGIIILCVVASWLEFALTVPIHYIFYQGRLQRLSAPRNGGDKNYVRPPPETRRGGCG